MLLLYLVIEPHEARVPVEVSVDATIGDLRAAVHDAGGPPAHLQQLSVGAEALVYGDDVPLSDTTCLGSEVTVRVGRTETNAGVIAMGAHHTVAFLGGCMRAWGAARRNYSPMPDWESGVRCLSVGGSFSAAVVEGRLEVWGSVPQLIRDDLKKVRRRKVASCSASDSFIAVAFADGTLRLLGSKSAVPDGLQGRVRMVCYGDRYLVVLTTDGRVESFGKRNPCGDTDIGGLRAVHVAAGRSHFAAVTSDRSVLCFGSAKEGQCAVPAGIRGVIDVVCGDGFTAVLLVDGTVRWWGSGFPVAGEEAAVFRRTCSAIGGRGPVFATVQDRHLVVRSKRGILDAAVQCAYLDGVELE
eukprot:TRINITY_DN2692_c0_g1_i2.p1 TRINITY_DN2692_c0_g1~~TRINITY_DN2692_c0_g1_i2.p1  ORF type:complete len:355 (+),score=73.42 TRINITY_DN2692_c0_g1_i2:85-1149(+)